jgi:ATP-dependent DNA helicase RecG
MYVLREIQANRPQLVLPDTSAAAIQSLDWSVDTWRAVHYDLTHSLRGLVEDLGYDVDLLPAPPALQRTMTLAVSPDGADCIVLVVPDPDAEVTTAVKAVPGVAWDGEARQYTVPVAGPVIESLRGLIRGHRFTVDTVTASRLKQVAEQVAAHPELASLATVGVSGKKVVIRFAVTNPALADTFKRVPSLKWDAEENAFTAPSTRLREVLAVARKFPIFVEESARSAADAADAPLTYDGTLEGLRSVPLTDLRCVDAKKAERFSEFGLDNVLDLLMLIPRRYLDRANLTLIRSLRGGEEVGLLAVVASINVDPRRRMVKITVSDGTGKINVTYFNAIWQAKRFRVGDEVAIYGKIETWNGGGRTMLSLTNPIMDPVGDETLPVIPVYPQSAKSRVTTWEIQSAVAETLRRLGDLVDPFTEQMRTDILSAVPDLAGEQDRLLSRVEALKSIHVPTSLGEADAARTRLAFDELFRMQAALLLVKASEEDEVGVSHQPTGVLTAALHAQLPFPLTGAQQRAIAEIDVNLRAPHPMHRLLQGDVGSGKSLVALTTLLSGVESGYQGALMAPTEILASQLFAELRDRSAGLSLPDGTPLRVEFFSNKLRGKARTAAVADLASGAIHIAVGTHALLVGDVEFENLGVVVVDEQHRFGVEQRATLRAKGPVRVVDGKDVHIRPDMLVMTATPIPRTAAMTVFGDLDVSVLDELPPGRTPIATSWIDAEPDLEHAGAAPWDEVRAQVAQGRQAYVVCPLVEESEKMQAASATETFSLLQAGALSGLRLGLVHGQQNSEERAATMAAFRDGQLDVLVATTVIEVGVNVPNATVIAILDANRFGIAQLHQLRGRVGRGQHASSCVLVGRCVSGDARARMEALVSSTDGFYLSEVDLALRGHGQVFGAAQSGQSDLRVADLDTDRELLFAARQQATRLLAVDPKMASVPALRSEIATLLGRSAQDWLLKS